MLEFSPQMVQMDSAIFLNCMVKEHVHDTHPGESYVTARGPSTHSRMDGSIKDAFNGAK